MMDKDSYREPSGFRLYEDDVTHLMAVMPEEYGAEERGIKPPIGMDGWTARFDAVRKLGQVITDCPEMGHMIKLRREFVGREARAENWWGPDDEGRICMLESRAFRLINTLGKMLRDLKEMK